MYQTLLILLCCLTANAAPALRIYFIDVENGSSTLLVSPSGESMLIDGGSPGMDRRVLAAMDSAGVKQIDYLLITHYHSDHYGSIPKLADEVKIVNWIDHGMSVEAHKGDEWKLAHRLRADDTEWDRYVKARSNGNHIVAQPGDHLPIKGVDVLVLTASGRQIAEALPGAGQPNPACDITPLRHESENEDSQSVGVLVTFGKFRFIFLGDLTWNNDRRLVCPNNLVGPVDVYQTTHHAMSVDPETGGEIVSGYSAGSEAEVWGLHPRVAVLNAGARWHGSPPLNWHGGPRALTIVRNSPGLEDFWQLHYQPDGGSEYNVPEQFIANISSENCQGNWLLLSANEDASFSITNSRSGFTGSYSPRP